MNKKLWIGIGIAAAVVGTFTLSVLQPFKTENHVEVVKLKEQKVEETLTTSGTLTAGKQQNVYLQPERGELKKVLVKPGQKVKKGQRLVEYDSESVLAEKKQAELQVKTAKVNLDNLYKQKKKIGSTAISADPMLGNIPPTSASKDEINQQIELAKLELERAKQQLSMTETRQGRLYVTSEFEGTIVQANEQAGIASASTEPLVIVADLSQLKVTANISEYDALNVKTGQPVAVKTDALPDQEWKATVEKIALLPKNSTDPLGQGEAQVTYPIEIQLKDSVPMKLGSRLIVEVHTASDQVTGIPISAIQEVNNESYVFVVNGGKAKQVKVKTGKRNVEFIEIVSGLQANDLVILKPGPDLKDGSEVKVQ
ncbi:efflux RND transporter periplasmic adaptor subunit [Hazenella coriacea]|uniref:HlyD family secretion protein n=1 Tax=Hazenella coriacea TaxID=1179467 RepID=A0A4V2UV38_9BACL|nr:efflux RND transporter periplasmic adaptor subunit [Hazenella coriacea]TCS94247.1 HlyD family secretion protein [Hazenella coriacea]